MKCIPNLNFNLGKFLIRALKYKGILKAHLPHAVFATIFIYINKTKTEFYETSFQSVL